MNHKIFKSGFTLAEVLITIGIIGIVAALTIPSLIENYKKNEYAAKIKKTYNLLEQTVRLAGNDYGPFTGWTYTTTDYDGEQSAAFAEKYLIPYMKVAKDCGTGTGCWTTKIHMFSGSDFWGYDDSDKYAKFVLEDGTTINVAAFSASNSAYGALIHFDINGLQGPNIYGKDIFTYFILPKYYPFFGFGDYKTYKIAQLIGTGANACTKTATQPDECLALIAQEGWKIDDDYPCW